MMPAITSVRLRPLISFFSSRVWMTMFRSKMENAISNSPVSPNRSPGMTTAITNSVNRLVLIASSGSVSSLGWSNPSRQSARFWNRCRLRFRLRIGTTDEDIPSGQCPSRLQNCDPYQPHHVCGWEAELMALHLETCASRFGLCCYTA